MSKAADAWEDDWISPAAKAKTNGTSEPKILTKSERKAQHQEANRKLWDSAEQPERNHFLESHGVSPLNQDFKPQVKVLSRKPTVPVASATKSIGGLNLDDEDSEEEERRKAAESLVERQRKAALEREEKQRKYKEARERIMGPSAQSQATNIAKSTGNSRQSSRRGRNEARGSQTASPAEGSPVPVAKPAKQLYDPDFTAKPQDMRTVTRSETPKMEQPIRAPRGPDASGRGGFAARGGRGG